MDCVRKLQNDLETDEAWDTKLLLQMLMEFGIPNESQVSIVIYDMQGRLVETLVDQYMDAGYHVVVWNAGYYSSGMYFVMMQADKYIKTQKLMLVK